MRFPGQALGRHSSSAEPSTSKGKPAPGRNHH